MHERLEKLAIDIKATQNKLIKKAARKGIYENFGQKEVRELEDKHLDISDYGYEMKFMRATMEQFSKWCSHYNV
jgi:hypothetical protein